VDNYEKLNFLSMFESNYIMSEQCQNYAYTTSAEIAKSYLLRLSPGQTRKYRHIKTCPSDRGECYIIAQKIREDCSIAAYVSQHTDYSCTITAIKKNH
jgi:hypothetical protein